MRTFVYVDGFNLYYGCLENTPFRWLDLPRLFETILEAHHDIKLVRYFTSRISSPRWDPTASQRQDIYLRALTEYRACLKVHLGTFVKRRKWRQRAGQTKKPAKVEIEETREKGSDVNLAVHLLNDAWQGTLDCAVVVTNDSDVAEALRLVRRLGLPCEIYPT